MCVHVGVLSGAGIHSFLSLLQSHHQPQCGQWNTTTLYRERNEGNW